MKQRLWNSYAAYSGSYFVFYFANGVICNILSVYLLGEGHSALSTSLIISASSLFSILLQPLIGAANDRLKNPAVVIGVTVLASALCGLFFGQVGSFVLLFLLNGLCVSLCDGVCMLFEQMAAATPYAYGSIRIWGTIGYAVAAQVVTVFYQRVSHFSVFILFAAAMVLSLGILRLLPLKQLFSPVKRPAVPAAGGGLRAVLKIPALLLFLVLCFLFRGIFTVSSTYLPPLFMSRGLSISAAGTVVFLSTMTEVPLLLLSGRFMDRLRSRPALVLCFSGSVLILLLLGLAQALPLLILAAMLRPLVGMLFNMLTLKIALTLVDPLYTSTAIGLTGAAKCAGIILFQSVGGSVMDAFGIQSLFLFLLGVALAGLALCACYREPESAQAPAIFSGR